VFQATLGQVVHALGEQLAEGDRERWLELLSYVEALIYHEREEPEREPMQRLVEEAVQQDPHRWEVVDMGQSMAEFLRLWRIGEEAVEQESHRREVFDLDRMMVEILAEDATEREVVRVLQRTLLPKLHLKFRRVPKGVVKRVENTAEVTQLEAWLKALIKARKLADVGIPPLEE
jgi:hypothetical protein